MKLAIASMVLAASAGVVAPASWKAKGTLGSAVVGAGAAAPSRAFLAGGANGVGAEVLATTDGGNCGRLPTSAKHLCFWMYQHPRRSRDQLSSTVSLELSFPQMELHSKALLVVADKAKASKLLAKTRTESQVLSVENPEVALLFRQTAGSRFKAIAATSLDENHPARYAAFPTDTTWYVTAGAWPSNAADTFEKRYGHTSKLAKELSEMVQLRENTATGKFFVATLTEDDFGGNVGNVSEYTGAIAKTTDGGKTWENVYEHDGEFYSTASIARAPTYASPSLRRTIQPTLARTSSPPMTEGRRGQRLSPTLDAAPALWARG